MLRECDYSQALLEQVVVLSPGKRWMCVVIAELLITTRPSW